DRGAAGESIGLSRSAVAIERRSICQVAARLRHTAHMRVLVVGAGGVGAAFAAIAQQRPTFERVTLADLSPARARAAVAKLGEADRFAAEQVDASNPQALARLIAKAKPDVVLNATDPRFNRPIFDAAFDARTTYLDMAMTLSKPHPQRPHELPGTMLGEYQL